MSKIFCLESYWNEKINKTYNNLVPALNILKDNSGVKWSHRHFISADDFKYFVDELTYKANSGYDILYVACHGHMGAVRFENGDLLSLEEFFSIANWASEGRVLLLSSCLSLGVSKQRREEILSKTRFKFIAGYSKTVDWMYAMFNDLYFLEHVAYHDFTEDAGDIMALKNSQYSKGLGFQVWRP